MRRSTPALTAALVAAALSLTACSGGAEKESDAPASAAPKAVEQPSTLPFNGLEATGTGEVEHPAFVVKVDNSGAATQVGLSSADLVFEELVEGGTTRLAAVYYSQLPTVVGPVRSMRATDVGIIAGTGAQIVTSGGAPEAIAPINAAGITIQEEGATGLFRDSTRKRPYNLMADLTKLAEANAAEAARPDDYFSFGIAEDLPEGEPVQSVAVGFGTHTSTWTPVDGGWELARSNAAEGDEFVPETVLVLSVEVEDAGYTDAAGNAVPESVFEGEGVAQLFHDGKVVTGTWRKTGLDGELRLKVDGRELKVPAGRTWVELVPVTGKVTVTP
ncbi:DUF3048 domain-containing protein [Nocardioides yefusunii]|uniref:DUF3048 domain-containing protein n=1 Tax=Nocardioides yefusunii TaxID=2500546 RepID=A0ABW1QWG6_9ACTN|nr:DUF3048 domain-containing protein [Nocardioides yefusunii]